jgi:hypothetical protein
VFGVLGFLLAPQVCHHQHRCRQQCKDVLSFVTAPAAFEQNSSIKSSASASACLIAAFFPGFAFNS